jgi:hypothetical protein
MWERAGASRKLVTRFVMVVARLAATGATLEDEPIPFSMTFLRFLPCQAGTGGTLWDGGILLPDVVLGHAKDGDGFRSTPRSTDSVGLTEGGELRATRPPNETAYPVIPGFTQYHATSGRL